MKKSHRALGVRVGFLREKLSYLHEKTKKRPLRMHAAWLLGEAAGLLIGLLLLPLTALMHLAGFRYASIFTGAIGHLALEPDCLLKEQAMGNIRKRRWIMLAPRMHVPNRHLLRYWMPYFHIVQYHWACYCIRNMARFGLMHHNARDYVWLYHKAQKSHAVYAQWGASPPLLALTPDDQAWSEQALRALGLPQGTWFVCLHAREGGYAIHDETMHSHRNSRVEDCMLAIQEIVARGGWVIRIGDSSMTPLPAMPQVIDYVHHPLKSWRLDIVLCAKARFVLGSTSGICLVSSIFGVPAAIANMVPTADRWFRPGDLSIPKLTWSESENRLLSLDESFAYPLGCYRYARQWKDTGLRVVDNSPEDIRDLAVEMMDRLDGRFAVTQVDRQLTQHYRSMMDARYTSHGSAAEIGACFLRKYGAAPQLDR